MSDISSKYNDFRLFSALAYCKSIYSTNTLSCGSLCSSSQLKETTLETTVVDSVRQGAFQIYRRDDVKQIVIAFRGTNSKTNVIADLQFWKGTRDDSDMFPLSNAFNEENNMTSIPFETPTRPGKVKIHTGFSKTYANLRGYIFYAVNGLIKDFPDYEYVITGHSLGGALAQLCAMDLAETHHIGKNMSVITYGQPRVGNSKWASYVGTLPYGKNVFRFSIMGDPVILLPPRAFGFRHNINQYMVTSDDKLRKCDYKKGKTESPSCIWPLRGRYIPLHQTYLPFHKGC